MQEIWLPIDLQWIRHSCSIWGGWVKRTKGAQRFSMLSFLAKAWNVKLCYFFCVVSIWPWRCIISNWQELNHWPFSAHMRMHARKKKTTNKKKKKKNQNNFSSYLHRFPPTATSTWVHERVTSILGRIAVEHCWERRTGAELKVTPIWGNWAGGVAVVGQ